VNLSKAQLYWETLRHLRPVQFYGRVWFRAVRPKPDLRAAPPLREKAADWVRPARRRQSLFEGNLFRFLNEEQSLDQHGWDDPALAKLWRYNLHYFDDLNAEVAEAREAWHRTLIERWIRENPPGQGTAWEPYPTSLRIVNWLKWVMQGNKPSAEMLQSLAIQARWLSGRLEYHLLGNHLFANAKALVFAGCAFDGPEAAKWLDRGLRILAREVPEQILPDGGQFELSPMYHALAVEDMLDLLNVMRTKGQASPALWEKKLGSMRTWLKTMCHPDGEIAFFNDAAFGIAPSLAELERYAADMGYGVSPGSLRGCTWLRESGYVRLQNERAVALLDVARVGPDYLPGHAHADTLSFELSVGGQRVIVNSGTSVYGDGPERLRQRSTSAHSTVIIDGQNSSEVWSGFRVARRAYPQGLAVEERGDGSWNVSCAHDGYRRLPGKPLHRRSWKFGANGLIVSDRVEGTHRHAEAVFHFHPDLTASISEDGKSGVTSKGDDILLRWSVKNGAVRLIPSTRHPEFGFSIPSQQLAIELVDGQSTVEFHWA